MVAYSYYPLSTMFVHCDCQVLDVVNITEWLKQRTVNKENKARRLCPHTIMDLDGATNQLKVMSQYTSPFGTTAWICSRCGDVSYSEEEVMQNTDYWGRNIQRYIERNEQIEKLLK